MDLSRRHLLAAAPAAAAVKAGPDPFSEAAIKGNLERYAGFGIKATGGAGDRACGAWMEGELKRLGYKVQRQRFQAPYFEVAKAELAVGPNRASLIPQAVVVPTPAGGLSAPLRLAEPGANLAGAIALIVLPDKRWSTGRDPDFQKPVSSAFAGGASAAVVITTGPTHHAIALNAPPEGPMFQRPVAVLGPDQAEPFLRAAKAGEPAVLTLTGKGGTREAFNLVARMKRGGSGVMIMSTPRSGWFTCAAERGSGVAAWLAMAAWLAKTPLKVDLELLCTSGHEYEYLGGARYIEEIAPKPAETRLWAHLGANVAARDWRASGGSLTPLDTADPLRVLMVSPKLIEPAKAAFAGQPGLETPRPGTKDTAAGELANVLHAGYEPTIGIFGTHMFHHARADDLRCTSAALTRQAAVGFRQLVAGVLT